MYVKEIKIRQALKECEYCKEKKERLENYYEEMEKDKVEQCLRALEREKILEADRRHKEMLDRRKVYDEQIASANNVRKEMLKEEREKEKRRLERMREKMEQDHYEEEKNKRAQQMSNKANFIEGHKLKALRKIEEKSKEREIDNHTIRVAMQELKTEKLRKRNDMLNWRREEELFTENFNRERKIAQDLETEGDKIAQEWKQQEDQKADKFFKQIEIEKRNAKIKAIQDYQKYLEKLKEDAIKERIERKERMHRVSKSTYKELQRKLENANQELKKQIDYRNSLCQQIQDNQNTLKIYLIEMIHAKKFKTAEEVENIVQRVKLERRQLSQVRKNIRKRIHLQGTEISSTSNTLSPPITNTPKCPPRHIVIQCSPNGRKTIMKYAHPNLLHSPHLKKTYASLRAVASSDRVLRSFNIKSHASQANINSDLLKAIKTQNSKMLRPAITQRQRSAPQETRINLFSEGDLYCKVNVTAKCMGKTPIVYMQKSYSDLGLANESRAQLVAVQDKIKSTPTVVPAKRQRMLSGIYPLTTKEPTPKVSYEYMQSISFRRTDGKTTKINALVQKSLNNEPSGPTCRNIDLTVQDLINSNIDSQNMETESSLQQTFNNMQYPNMTSLEYLPTCSQKWFNYFDTSNEAFKENEYSQSSTYYHKKIRGEQIRSQRRMSIQKDMNNLEEQRLPRINEVFSKFSDAHDKDITQPIYIQVGDESERCKTLY
ncbi:unnamed protein product [Diatraea saccharalis]|uniref:Uncharacterized protein n=1 Tax=Diatraea saccharalis TaxID=40085 RepID=A0A9N9WF91_9NEOP|nr:unnamed protein product [Diatraea saccharalis]